jgi:pilus assembly protein CpaF
MSREAIFQASVSYFLAPIRPFLDEELVTEIMVNGCDQIYIERRGRLELTSARFPSDDALLSAIHNVAQWVGREINEERPVLDARLPNGSRVHAVIPPASRRIYLTIRKFSRETLTLDDFVRFGSLSPAAKEFLELCVRMKKNVLIAGGTGTGKTSLLGAMSRAIPEEERIVVIEDTAELRLLQQHSLYLEARPPNAFDRGGLTVRQLFVASLRMRPDRIIVGEVRSGEALDLVQSMLSGHAGSLSTVHANSPRDALTRLETLSLMSEIEIPVYVARAQVGSAIHVIAQLARFSSDGSRKVTHICELCGLDDDNRYQLADLFAYKVVGEGGRAVSELAPTGVSPSFRAELAQYGLQGEAKLTRSLWTE